MRISGLCVFAAVLFAFVSSLEAGPVKTAGKASASVARCGVVRGAAKGATKGVVVAGRGATRGVVKVAGWIF